MKTEKELLETAISITMKMFNGTNDTVVRRNCAVSLTDLFERYSKLY